MKKIIYVVAALLPLWFASSSKPSPADGQNEDFVFGAVDIGLSVKWANANLGAASPEDYGDYYAWGETTPKVDYTWKTYKWCKGSETSLTKYNTSPEYGTIDNKTQLDPEDDVAHVKLGGTWRMPTADEIDELVSTQNRPNYRWDKIIVDDDEVAWKVTYLDNGNSITLPTACYKFGTTLIYSISIWSSSLDPLYPYEAFFLCLYNTGLDLSFDTRSDGVPIRPVCD